MLNIILFGPPGAGKGTQSKKITHKYDLIHLSTGYLFRQHMGEGTNLGKLAHDYIDDGNLVPDELVIRMVKDKIDNSLSTKGFVFDGFPRTVTQAIAFDEMLNKQNMAISIMLSLEVADDELKARLKLRSKTSGRAEDQTDERIENRINIYKEKTLPLIEYYHKQGKHLPIEGVGNEDKIFNDICATIDSLKN